MSSCSKVRVFGAKSFLIISVLILTIWMLASWLAQDIMVNRSGQLSTGESNARKVAQMFFSFPSPMYNKYHSKVDVPSGAMGVSIAVGVIIAVLCGFAGSAGGVPHGGPKGWKCSQ